MARSGECRCEQNFTCGYCLRNAKPWFFTADQDPRLRPTNWWLIFAQELRRAVYIRSRADT